MTESSLPSSPTPPSSTPARDPVAPPSGPVEGTLEAGLQLKVRSQWSYARMRFFRHRLALLGLFGLVVIFGAGCLRGFHVLLLA
jgi:hypothetical protein